MHTKWICTFCGKTEDSMIHTTCIEDGKHYYFCTDCFDQWEGYKNATNKKIQELKCRLTNKDGANE